MSFLSILFCIFALSMGVVIGLLLNRNKLQVSENSRKLLEEQFQKDEERTEREHRERIEALEDSYQQRIVEQKEACELQCQRTEEQSKKAQSDTIARLENSYNQRIQDLKRDYEERITAQQKAHNALVSELKENHKKENEGLKNLHVEMLQNVAKEMKVSTQEMLKQRQEEFSKSSHDNLGQIVNPLRESIKEMRDSLEKNTKDYTRSSGEMWTHIDHMIKQSNEAKQSIEEFSRVFKRQNKVQGDWGELVLTELLEKQGLKRGIHFDIQATLRDPQGNPIKHSESNAQMRPDVILHLDAKREVIIDSKVSLSAYMDYVNAEDEATRKDALKRHVSSIKNHADSLSKKDYASYIRPPKVRINYVIMFVPHSGALWTALNHESDLWRNAMEKNVFIADEQSLYAALRIIQLTWTQIEQVKNQQKVYDIAEEMIKRVENFLEDYKEMGKALNKAKDAFNIGLTKLQPNGHSIVNSCKKLESLGAKSKSNKNTLSTWENYLETNSITLPEVTTADEDTFSSV